MLTGSTGFLGNIIYQKLIQNHDVCGVSRSTNSFFSCDLSKEIPSFETKFDLVIHAAGIAHLNEFEEIDIYKTNVQGTINLLNSFNKSILPEKFVFISSVSVYGRNHGYIIDENEPLSANDIYGKCKIASEKLIFDWGKKNNVQCTILRLPLVVGPNPPGNLGSMINAIKKGYYFNIAGGNAKKSMVLATDVSKFILLAAEKGGTYNLTDGYHPSFKALSKSIAFQVGKAFVPNMPKFIALLLAKIGDLLGNKFPINSQKLSKITSTLTFDDTKARLVFGWDPSPVLDFFKIKQDVK